MINAPEPAVLFSAIAQASLDDVQAYIDQGGALDVRSARGYPVLAEVAMAAVQPDPCLNDFEDEEDEEDDFLNNVTPTASSLEFEANAKLSQRQDSLKRIGEALIEKGLDFEARCGRTNRSIKISQMVKARSPLIYNDWLALYQRALIQHAVEESVDMDAKKSSPLKKI